MRSRPTSARARCAVRHSGARLAVALAIALPLGCQGELQTAGGEPRGPVSAERVAARAARQADARAVLATLDPDAKQILFGDLHVHTTFSFDAFLWSLPILQGEGAHPPMDACDFARFCSDLDFFSLNDHAETLSVRLWRETTEAARRCSAQAGGDDDPDLVVFPGWEWSQVGTLPENHWGHRNVIFKDLDDAALPARPISARTPRFQRMLADPMPFYVRAAMTVFDFPSRRRYWDLGAFLDEAGAEPVCARGVDTRELPPVCHEVAATPAELLEKLAQWGAESLVIPHGTTWGLYTPPGVRFDKQLAGAQHDPERQRLIEVFSGHGNSEEYRPWRAVTFDAAGEPVCPGPTADYLPCCWQAGEIIRQRCEDPASDDCARRVTQAREDYVRASVPAHLTVPGAEVADWKDCGQCRDCFQPAFNFRPGNSVQYALALSDFDDPAAVRRFRFGLLASSDNHSARPGTGYKEVARIPMADARGARSAFWQRQVRERAWGPPAGEPVAESRPVDPAPEDLLVFQIFDVERQASFFLTGGLVAVHAAGRDRDAIWQALRRREVYGTSGDRMLLWFDLVNGPAEPRPMGSEVALGETPRFRVRALGGFVQQPGCPEEARAALGAERLEALCRSECYHPGERRRRVTRIEVVRIRPQIRPDEPVDDLIEDPWRSLPCAADAPACVVEFDDPDFVAAARPATYYVRAIQEPTEAVNARALRCEYDAAGNCVAARPCYGDYRTPIDDDCLAPTEERAWSSPIFVEPVR